MTRVYKKSGKTNLDLAIKDNQNEIELEEDDKLKKYLSFEKKKYAELEKKIAELEKTQFFNVFWGVAGHISIKTSRQ